MGNRVTKVTAVNSRQILFDTDRKSVSILVSDADAVTENGKKIVKAGTPMTGDFKDRTKPFKKGESDVVGVLEHDVDVTNGENNGTLIYWGSVNLDRIDKTTAALITENVEEALKGCIWFFKDN